MDFVNSLQTWELWVMLLVGILLMFAGYRIKKIAFFIIWFLLGYNIVGYFLPQIIKMVPQVGEAQIWQILVPVGGGLLLALLGFSIEKVCISGVCFVLTMLIAIQQFGTGIQVLSIGGVVAVVMAGIGVMLMKPATIVATAVAGSYAMTMALIVLALQMGGWEWSQYYWPILLLGAGIGSLVQFFTTKHVS